MRKRIWLLSLFAFLLLCTYIVDTYGLFETNGDATSEFSIGRWVILLNGSDITINRELTLRNFSYIGNQHIQSGYFAPGGTGTLDMIIDASDTDVALEYSITFDTTELADHPNMILTITNTDTNQVVQGGTYTGTMLLTDDREISLQLAIAWQNDPSYDENDSVLIDEPISIGVDIEFRQLLRPSSGSNANLNSSPSSSSQ